MKDLAGKVAVVTGAASGIGLGLARTCVRAGMSVAMCDIRADRLEQAVAQVRLLGQGRVITVTADVSKADSVEAAAQKIESEFGKIHLVFNNAGVVIRGQLMEKIDDKTWDWLLGANLYGVIHGIRSFVPLLHAAHPCPRRRRPCGQHRFDGRLAGRQPRHRRLCGVEVRRRRAFGSARQ